MQILKEKKKRFSFLWYIHIFIVHFQINSVRVIVYVLERICNFVCACD